MPDALPSAERTNSATIEGLLLYEAGQRDGEVLATKRIVTWLRKEADDYEAVNLKEWAYAYSRAAASIERGEHEESGDGR